MESIWITVILGVITAVTGGLAGHLAAQKGWHKWAFWGAALFTVGLLFVQGVLMQKDIKNAEERGKQEQAQLNRIEKNTGQPPSVIVSPPIVNVSPPYPATAIPASRVILDHFDSVYSSTVTGANNVPIGQLNQLFKVGDPIALNFYFRNLGDAVASEAWSAGQIILATSETTEEQLVSAFKAQLKKDLKVPAVRSIIQHGGGVIEQGGNNVFWFTITSPRRFTPDDLPKLENGTERLYILMALGYKDPLGSHYIHLCQWLQAPVPNQASQPAVWHFCNGFSDRK